MSRLLVVEDDASLRVTLKTFLEAKGYTVDDAADESEAKERLASNQYDVIIADMVMKSQTGGIEVLEAAKNKDPLSQVIVLTGYGTVPTVLDSMRKGAFTYLEKKGADIAEFDVLVEQIKRALEFRGAQISSRAATEFASGDLTAVIDVAAKAMDDLATRVKECSALLTSAANARDRLLRELEKQH